MTNSDNKMGGSIGDFNVFNFNGVSKKFKEKQDQYLLEVKDFFNLSKENHYAGSENEIEAVDVIQSVGALREFMVGNVIKYVLRFGKKKGFNKEDLFKSIQYLIWLAILTESSAPQNVRETEEEHPTSPLKMFVTKSSSNSYVYESEEEAT